MTGLLISASILVVVVGGVIATQIFGLKTFQIVSARQGVGPTTQIALRQIGAEIRGAKSVLLGNGTVTTFTQLTTTALQQANSLEIHTTGDASVYIRYYTDSKDNTLKRIESGRTLPTVVASYLKSLTVFTAEDSQGNVLSEYRNNQVLGISLDFTQLEGCTTKVGTGNQFVSFPYRAKISYRNWE